MKKVLIILIIIIIVFIVGIFINRNIQLNTSLKTIDKLQYEIDNNGKKQIYIIELLQNGQVNIKNNVTKRKIEDKKINSINKIVDGDNVKCYLKSEDNKAYILMLQNNDIDNLIVNEIGNNVIEIMDYKLDYFNNLSNNTVVLKKDDMKLIISNTDIEYIEGVVNLNNQFFMYNNGIIVNKNNEKLLFKENESLKYIIYIFDENNILSDQNFIFVGDLGNIYYQNLDLKWDIFNKKVESIKKGDSLTFEISFSDGTKESVSGFDDSRYFPVK